MKYTDKTIQYPRLLAEIRAIGLDKDQYALLSESMDLSQDEIDQVLEWAEDDWQTIKDNLSGSRLIASAPELLVALKQCFPLAQAHVNYALGEGGYTLEVARAAIAKAEGREK